MTTSSLLELVTPRIPRSGVTRREPVKRENGFRRLVANFIFWRPRAPSPPKSFLRITRTRETHLGVSPQFNETGFRNVRT